MRAGGYMQMGKGQQKGGWQQQQQQRPATPQRPMTPQSRAPVPQKPAVQQAGFQQGQKRPMSAPPAQPTAAKQAKPETSTSANGPDSLTVVSKKAQDEIGIQTILGDYVVQGMNHQRKYYKKTQKIAGHENVQAFLYYWDDRDGAEFSGWWFGDKVGGEQVWSRNSVKTVSPPMSGWKIPWDGAVNPHLSITYGPAKGAQTPAAANQGAKPGVPKPSMGQPAKPGAAPLAANKQPQQPPGKPPNAAGNAQVNQALPEARKKLATLEVSIKAAVTKVQNQMKGTPTEQLLQQAETSLNNSLKEINETQKFISEKHAAVRNALGTQGQGVIEQLNTLMPKVTACRQQVNAEMSKVKQSKNQANQKKQAEAQKKQAEANKAKQEQDTKKQEENDAKAVKELLPKATEIVTTAEAEVENASIAGSMLLSDLDASPSDLDQLFKDTELSAAKGQAAINKAKTQIQTMLLNARKFAPEARKTAIDAFTALQKRMEEAQNKVNPYKNARREHQQRKEAQKVMDEAAEKLGEAEAAVEKIAIDIEVNGADASADAVKKMDQALGQGSQTVSATLRFIENASRGKTGSTKNDLMQLQERGRKSQKRLEELKTSLKEHKDKVLGDAATALVFEKIQKFEELLLKTADAEMPFLKGIEVLPTEEGNDAILACEEAAKSSQNALNDAKNTIKVKLVEAGRFAPATKKAVTDELNDMQKKLGESEKKLMNFKKETTERKLTAVIGAVMEKVSAAETLAKKGTEACKKISDAKTWDEVNVEKIAEAQKECSEIQKEGSAALNAARQMVVSKQNDKATRSTAGMDQELQKLQQRLSTCQQSLSQTKQAGVKGQTLVNVKSSMKKHEEQVEEVEAGVLKADEFSTPTGDEFSDSQVEQITEAVTESQTKLTAALKSLAGTATLANQLSNELKTAYSQSHTKLTSRAKEAQQKLDKIKASTREQRERVLCASAVRKAEELLQQAETAMEKTGKAEEPFLKGMELLPIEQTREAVGECESAEHECQSACNAVRSFISTKQAELNKFSKDSSKEPLEALQKTNLALNGLMSKLTTFKKETLSRKKTLQFQECEVKVDDTEAEVKKVAEAAAPLAEAGFADKPEDEAKPFIETLLEVQKSAQKKLDESRTFLRQRQNEAAQNETRKEILSKLAAKLNDIQVELAKVKKSTADVEQKFAAQKLMWEANELADKVVAVQDAILELSKPLVEEKGEKFLAYQLSGLVVDALQPYMADKKLSIGDVFKKANGGKSGGAAGQEAFVKFLEDVAELTGKDLVFTEAQRVSMFKSADADNDGEVSEAEFSKLFQRTYTCTSRISMTDGVEISKSKTIEKLEAATTIESIPDVGVQEDAGVRRLNCKIAGTDKIGWVTLMGNQGTVFLKEVLPFEAYAKDLDSKLASSANEVRKYMKQLQDLINTAPKQGGPLADAKKKLETEVKTKASAAMSKLDGLRNKINGAKNDLKRRQDNLAKDMQNAKDKRDAAKVLEPLVAIVAAAEAKAAEVPLAGEALTKLSPEELSAVEAPVSILDAVEAKCTAATEAIAASRASAKEQSESIAQAAEAMSAGAAQVIKNECQALKKRLDQAEGKKAGALNKVKVACSKIAKDKVQTVVSSMKAAVQESGKSCNEFFAELKDADADCILESRLLKYIKAMPGLDMSPDHATLVLRQICTSGRIGRVPFLQLLQTYMTCVKEIAMTTEFDIAATKTVRKLELSELIEVLAGAKKDEGTGLERVKVRSLKDGKIGWVTLTGNAGTAYFKDAPKPYFSVSGGSVVMQAAFSSASDEVRAVGASEVLEVIEGPKQEKFEDAKRCRVKTSSDSKVGWVTLVDRSGQVIAEKDDRYYKCKQVIAITDSPDIKSSKVIRKIEPNEMLIKLEGPIEESNSTRIKCKCKKDDKEGWVTVKGNAGTKFLEEMTKYITIKKKTSMNNILQSEGGAVQRELEVDECVEALEDPKDEKSAPVNRFLVRAVGDGKEGWVSQGSSNKQNLKTWSSLYRCIKIVPVHDSVEASSAKEVKKLQLQENVEFLEGPKECDGDLRMYCRSQKDHGICGWVTIKAKDGTVYMQ
eukprot:gnl/MRDRNA2_/MRDRNA2_97280_c0_seq1.p1 gnl/MRDRNA2_/MRDRNA2_97280_c0~~gnl/MRDRNA2_/MRDRNA2_97280_c0_seq1.p1  ORF type:complete len:2064 (+),score=613.81 gnl/MRDRNA2_/MRDRNA2_97280_c0_seq1:164-6355(+)